MRVKDWMSIFSTPPRANPGLALRLLLHCGASFELKQTEIELTPQASAARSFIWPRFFLERDVTLPLVRQKCSHSINRRTAAAFHPVSRSAMPLF
jgi:hypothetical protein